MISAELLKQMIMILRRAVLLGLFLLPLFAFAAPPLTKPDVLRRLQQMQIRHTQEITRQEEILRKRLRDSTQISIKDNLVYSHRQIGTLGEQIGESDRRRAELLARREFINRLILQIEKNWNGQNLQKFLEFTTLDMASSDLSNQNGSGDLWKFATYFSIAVREAPEPGEDVVAFLESYLSFASILEPKTPAEFMASRNYTNGATSATARLSDRSNLGEYLEKRLKELEAKAIDPSKTPAPILAGTSQNPQKAQTSPTPADMSIGTTIAKLAKIEEEAARKAMTENNAMSGPSHGSRGGSSELDLRLSRPTPFDTKSKENNFD